MQELNFTRFERIHDITSSKKFWLLSAKLKRQEKINLRIRKIFRLFGNHKRELFFIHSFQKIIRAKSSKEKSMKIYQIGRGGLLECCGWKKHNSTIITCLCHHPSFVCHHFCAYLLTISHLIKYTPNITIWLWLFLLYRAPCYFHICHQWVWFCMTQ